MRPVDVRCVGEWLQAHPSLLAECLDAPSKRLAERLNAFALTVLFGLHPLRLSGI